jgi:hypothetical protein
MARSDRRRVLWVLVSIGWSFTVSLPHARAAAGVQVTRDGRSTLVSKDVAAERWAIGHDSADGSVTGNIFFPEGGEPRFVWCERTGTAGGVLSLRCSGANRCLVSPCRPDEWVFLADVDLPESFFAPPMAASRTRADSRDRTYAATPARPSVAARRSGVQRSPDGRWTLVSKDVGGERWAIGRDLESGTVTGNVFLPGGGEPRFVWCEQLAVDAEEAKFSCFGADRCPRAPCSSDAWSALGEVALPISFFEGPPTLDLTGLADAVAERLGEDGALDAVLLAVDGGYSTAQVLEAGRSRRLIADGTILSADGTGIEAPAGPPLGLIEVDAPPGAARPLQGPAHRLSEVRERLKYHGSILGITGEFILISLLAQGYSAEQVIEGIILDDIVFQPDRSPPVVILGQTPAESPTRSICGNAVQEPGEECDGAFVRECRTFDPARFPFGGTMSCYQCEYDFSECAICLNGYAQGDEECDPPDFRGRTCESLGFPGGGALGCDYCLLDTSGCSRTVCGDGVRDPGEECDGNDLGGATCDDAPSSLRGRFASARETATPLAGEPRCVACEIDWSGCPLPSECGNGVRETDEDCDGDDLSGLRCEDFGFVGGDLDCTVACTFDTADCTACDGMLCPDGTCAPVGADCCGGGNWCAPGSVCAGDHCCPTSVPEACGASCMPGGADCCDAAGNYCPAGWVCAGAGCCPADTPQPCPDGTCAPAGYTCCGGGASCPPGTVCVPGGCAPASAAPSDPALPPSR